MARTKGDGAELALFDYIAETRKPPRSHLHYNNWYSHEGKNLSVEHFIPNVYKPINDKLKTYGARLDAIVPDHGWQNSKAFEYIFQPKVDATHSPLPDLAKALMAHDKTHLGIWMALDGTNQSTAHGLKIGYKPAYAEGFERKARWMQGKAYFNILDPRYQRDLKKALRFLIVEAGQQDDRHVKRPIVHLGEGLQSLAVGQREIQQHHIHAFRSQTLQPGREAFRPLQVEGIAADGGQSASLRLRQDLTDQTGICGVVFDQQDFGGSVCHDPVTPSATPRPSARTLRWILRPR